MSVRPKKLLEDITALAAALEDADAILCGEAALHVHLAAATGSRPGEPPRYAALPPRIIEAIFRRPDAEIAGVRKATGTLAEVLSASLDLFSTKLVLADGTHVPVVTREAVLAQLLSEGGLAIGLAGSLLRVANTPPIDVDEVRELLKAARQGERFQPLLELLDVA